MVMLGQFSGILWCPLVYSQWRDTSHHGHVGTVLWDIVVPPGVLTMKGHQSSWSCWDSSLGYCGAPWCTHNEGTPVIMVILGQFSGIWWCPLVYSQWRDTSHHGHVGTILWDMVVPPGDRFNCTADSPEHFSRNTRKLAICWQDDKHSNGELSPLPLCEMLIHVPIYDNRYWSLCKINNIKGDISCHFVINFCTMWRFHPKMAIKHV